MNKDKFNEAVRARVASRACEDKTYALCAAACCNVFDMERNSQ